MSADFLRPQEKRGEKIQRNVACCHQYLLWNGCWRKCEYIVSGIRNSPQRIYLSPKNIWQKVWFASKIQYGHFHERIAMPASTISHHWHWKGKKHSIAIRRMLLDSHHELTFPAHSQRFQLLQGKATRFCCPRNEMIPVITQQSFPGSMANALLAPKLCSPKVRVYRRFTQFAWHYRVDALASSHADKMICIVPGCSFILAANHPAPCAACITTQSRPVGLHSKFRGS